MTRFLRNLAPALAVLLAAWALGCSTPETLAITDLDQAANRGDWPRVAAIYQRLLADEQGDYLPGGGGVAWRRGWLHPRPDQDLSMTDRLGYQVVRRWKLGRTPLEYLATDGSGAADSASTEQSRDPEAADPAPANGPASGVTNGTASGAPGGATPDVRADATALALPEWATPLLPALGADARAARPAWLAEAPALLALHRAQLLGLTDMREFARQTVVYLDAWRVTLASLASEADADTTEITSAAFRGVLDLGLECLGRLPPGSLAERLVASRVRAQIAEVPALGGETRARAERFLARRRTATGSEVVVVPAPPRAVWLGVFDPPPPPTQTPADPE